MKLAKRAQRKKKQLESKTDEVQEVVAEECLEEEPEEEIEGEPGSDNLAEDFEEGDDSDSEVVPDVEVTSKDQAARTLEVRRAIEERMEQRKFKDDLDYLDEGI